MSSIKINSEMISFIPSKEESSLEHSERIDRLLGLRCLQIETELARQETSLKTWRGLHPQTLQTPYSEIYEYLFLLRNENISTFVDLGAGYGRVAIVLPSVFPQAHFIGYELESKRVEEGSRIFDHYNIGNASLIEQNILDEEFTLPTADIYFIYDFSQSVADLKKIISKITQRLAQDKFFVIARGKGIRSLIQAKFPEFWSYYGVIHQENYSIYSSFRKLTS